MGGDSTGLQGSIVQKYDYYGTRLEAGTYRVVLEMKANDTIARQCGVRDTQSQDYHPHRRNRFL